jgi:hypothetical protein
MLALLGIVLAFASLQQGGGFEQNSHYALVRALADGTPRIDRTRGEVGLLSTQDAVRFKGHIYSNKVPGLAFLTLPAYLAVNSIHPFDVRTPDRALWVLGLVGVVLPAAILLLLVRWAADRIEPGFGTAAAVALGVGTLVLPYATMFFSHALSATLAFGAFALLLRERDGPSRPILVGAAGLCAALAVVVDVPTALIGGVVGLWALTRAPVVRRALAYTAGAVVGVAPLLLYNVWAFGSLRHFPVTLGNSLLPQVPGPNETGHLPGLSIPGVGAPSAREVLEALFSSMGLITLAPILLCGVVGTALLFRRGKRLEASFIAIVVAVFVAWDSGLVGAERIGPFGPGPRYLIPILPFLAFPLALSFRALPVTTTALALASTVLMVTVTATHPLAALDGDAFHRLATGELVPVGPTGLVGWRFGLLFFVAVVLAAGFAVAGTALDELRVRSRDVLLGAGALAGWAVIFVSAPTPAAIGGNGRAYSAYDALGLVVLASAVAAIATRVYVARLRRA